MNVKVTSAERRATLVIHYHGQFLPSAHAAAVLPSTPPFWGWAGFRTSESSTSRAASHSPLLHWDTQELSFQNLHFQAHQVCPCVLLLLFVGSRASCSLQMNCCAGVLRWIQGAYVCLTYVRVLRGTFELWAIIFFQSASTFFRFFGSRIARRGLALSLFIFQCFYFLLAGLMAGLTR